MENRKSRGKRVDNGEWVYGYYFYRASNNTHWIHLLDDIGVVKVIPESVGQYIGRNDKDGKEIYEGDIVVSYNPVLDECYEDRLKHKIIATMCNHAVIGLEKQLRLEIIGNKHDHPKLLMKEDIVKCL